MQGEGKEMRRQPAMEEISIMTRKEMKRYCRRYKLSAKGKNWVLKERLNKYVQTHNPPPVEEIVVKKPSAFDNLSPFDSALASYNTGNWDDSLEAYKESIETWPDSEELWVGFGNAQFQLGNHEDSLVSYEKAIELNEKSVLARMNKVNLLIGMGRYEEALAVCDEIETLDGMDEWVWLRKAHIYLALEKKMKALGFVQRILDWDDNLEEIWNLKGVLLMEADSESALRCFNKALELRDDYAIGLCNKGCALTRLGLMDDAKRCFDKALLYESRSEFWDCKGVLHMGLDEKLEAISCFAKAIEIDPQNAEAWTNRGTVLKEMNNLGEALACFQNALNICPEFEEAKFSLEEVHRILEEVGGEEETPIEDFLVSVPGIGRKKAKMIIESGFNSMDVLRKASLSGLSSVKGVGENLAHTIKEFVD
ncbi:MAG: tetratricopeptide repeat protein [Methanomassiliicoccales archaeon]|nr:MAG: tetratricopeptide repeat protein [Methanomassiliicoccales archaeon]